MTRTEKEPDQTPSSETAGEEYIRVSHEAAECMRRTAFKLEGIAQQLMFFTGTESPAFIMLAESSERLNRQAEALVNATHRKVADDLRVSEEMSTNLFRGAITGAISVVSDPAAKKSLSELFAAVKPPGGEE